MNSAESEALAATAMIDSYVTSQSLVATSGRNASSVVNAPEALGGRRRASIRLFDEGTVSLTIGGGQAAYKLEGSGVQGAGIGWLWYVDPSGPIPPIDLTVGGRYNAFQIDVLELTQPCVVQVDALDAYNRFDSVMSIADRPGQSLIYPFSTFISPSEPVKLDFRRIIGVQVEFDLHNRKAGSLKLGPLKVV